MEPPCVELRYVLRTMWVSYLLAMLACICSACGESPVANRHLGPLAPLACDCQPAWSPTSEWIAFVHRGADTRQLESIEILRPDGSERRRIVAYGYEPDWSPDGERIVYSDGFSTWVYGVFRDSLYELLPHGLFFEADWSPDGSRLAGVRSADGTPDIYVCDVTTADSRWVGPGECPDWSPGGAEILCLSNGVSVVDTSGAILLQVVPYVQGEGFFKETHWSPDGSRIVFSRGSSLWLVNADGSGLVSLGTGLDPAWSPDGEQIVFADDVPEGDWRSVRLWIMNADGTGRRQLTFPDTAGADEAGRR